MKIPNLNKSLSDNYNFKPIYYTRLLSLLCFIAFNIQYCFAQETEEEVFQTMKDLRQANVDVVTIGQYLQPSKKHLPVKEFITPDQFAKYEQFGLELGFRHVESGPLVRSSYKAQKHIL